MKKRFLMQLASIGFIVLTSGACCYASVREEVKSKFGRACRSGNITIVNEILKEEHDAKNFYPLSIACLSGNKEVVQYLLLQPKIDINAVDSRHYTAIHYAIRANDKEILKLLINQPEVSFETKKMALNYVLKHKGNKEFVQCLSNNLKEYNARIKSIRRAIRNNDRKTVERLLNKPGIDINSRYCTNIGKELQVKNDTFLHCAVKNNRKDMVEFLLTYPKIDVNLECYEYSPLYWAIENGHTQIAELLLNHPDIVDNNGIALKCAASMGSNGIMKKLLDKKEVDSDIINDCICLAIWAGNKEGVEYLFNRYQVNVNTEIRNSLWSTTGKTYFLHIAARSQSEDIIKFLLNFPEINVNAQSGGGETALFLISNEKGEDAEKAAKLLLNHSKIDVNISTHFGKAPIHQAIDSDNNEVLKLLLNNPKIDVNQKYDYKTPIKLAAKKNNANPEICCMLLNHSKMQRDCIDNDTKRCLLLCNIDIRQNKIIHEPIFHKLVKENDVAGVIRMLRAKEVDINSRDFENNTPLHIAVKYGSWEVSTFLLCSEDLNVNIKNIDGDTPIGIAAKNNNIRMIKEILECSSVYPEHKVNPNNLKEILDDLNTKTTKSEEIVAVLEDSYFYNKYFA